MAKVFLARAARDALSQLDLPLADAVLDVLDALGREPDLGYELRGRLTGLPGGQRVTVDGMDFYRMANGRIVEERISLGATHSATR